MMSDRELEDYEEIRPVLVDDCPLQSRPADSNPLAATGDFADKRSALMHARAGFAQDAALSAVILGEPPHKLSRAVAHGVIFDCYDAPPSVIIILKDPDWIAAEIINMEQPRKFRANAVARFRKLCTECKEFPAHIVPAATPNSTYVAKGKDLRKGQRFAWSRSFHCSAHIDGCTTAFQIVQFRLWSPVTVRSSLQHSLMVSAGNLLLVQRLVAWLLSYFRETLRARPRRR